MIQENTQIVQAFPVRANTFNGTANGFVVKGHNIIHAAEDCTITFNIGASSVALNVKEGQDIAFGDEVETINSTATVWIS